MSEEEILAKYRDSNGEIDWRNISANQHIDEEFIEAHVNEVKWLHISKYQHLTEPFINKHADKVNWLEISAYQKLSEKFIEQHAGEVHWGIISIYQHLSENFIEKHADKVDWYCISAHQHLSEAFIEKHSTEVNWRKISRHQCLSKFFRGKHADEIFPSVSANDNWLNKTTEFKKNKVEATGLYECYEDFFYAYKGIRSDRYSKFNFQYQYLPGETYECFADGSDEEFSFGFSVGTKEKAENYCNELVVKCKIYYRDVARVVHNGKKIRCSRITILE